MCQIYSELIITIFGQPEYMKWVKSNSFVSMLPKDRKSQKDESQASRQTELNPHLKPVAPKERILPYTDDRFRDAAIQWLIATDQVSIKYLIVISV